jgi:hypothetical protein
MQIVQPLKKLNAVALKLSLRLIIRQIDSISGWAPAILNLGAVAWMRHFWRMCAMGPGPERLPCPLGYGFLSWSINFRSQPGRI